MNIKFKGNPVFTNPFIPWEALIQNMLSKLSCYNNCEAVFIKPLSGGLSGAVVATIFPEGVGYEPTVVKIDLFDLINKEFSRYKKFLAGIYDNHILKLLFPTNARDLPRITGADLEEYSIIAYSYVLTAPIASSNIYTFDEMLYHNPIDIQKVNDILDILEKTLGNINSVKHSDMASKDFRPFDIPNIPWETFLPLAVTTSSLFPDWNKFVVDLPRKWADIRNSQNPYITYEPIVCHGDLRCANILLVTDSNGSIKPFLIDYGLTGPAHVLSDFPRLEADLLFRVGLKFPNHLEIFDSVLNWDSLDPHNLSNETSCPIFGLLSKIRKIAKNLARYHQVRDEVLIYRNYLLGNAVRFIRLNDPNLLKASNRQHYLWFVLSLAKRILAIDGSEKPSNLPLPLHSEAIFDMQACGVKDFFWGPERRNNLKKHLLLKGSSPVKLIAHTGKSYLDDTYNEHGERSGRFYDDLMNRIRNDNSFRMQIILLNPYSVEGSKLGIAEARGHLQGPELDLDYHEKYTELFKRFETCIEGYKSLRDQYRHNLELRISHYSTDATILLSDEVAFIEPYLVGRLSMRYTGGIYMNAPEFLVQPGSEMYKVAKEQFDFLWQRAITLEEYETRISSFKDDFMRSERLRRKLVALHESWYALDPIVGCPSQCDYCFLTPFHLNNKAPFIYRSAKDAYECLENYHPFVWQKTLLEDIIENDPRLPVPIACGNYTEMTDNKNKYDLLLPSGHTRRNNTNFEQLKHIIGHHSRLRMSSGRIPILCLITKQPLQSELIAFLNEELNNNNDLHIAFFISISFLPRGIERATDKGYTDLVKNFRLLSDLNKKVGGGKGEQCRVAGIHYWRPLILGLNSDNIDENMRLIKGSGATSSVAVGLKLSKRLEKYIRFKGGLGGKNKPGGAKHRFKLPNDIKNEYFDNDVRNDVVSKGKSSDHPVFLNTSCSISHAFGRPDYNAIFSECTPPRERIVDEVMRKCGIPKKVYTLRDTVIHGSKKYWVSITDEIEQEKQTFIRQMLGIEIEANVHATHEWRGNISELSFGKTCEESYCPDCQRQICRKYYNSSDRNGW